MADTELKKLNKNVEDAVNILKMYVGNSAQVKNMNEQQRKAIEKWFDVTEQQEEQVKRQRAFTERERDEHGRFVKKQEAMSFNFLGIAKSISGIFMGMAKGIGNHISGMVRGIASNLSGLFSAIKGHFLGLFGEESEWFDIIRGIWDALKGGMRWLFKLPLMLFRRSPKWASSMLKTLKKMYALQVKQMKMDFLGATPKKKGGILGAIGFLLMAIAMGIGAWLHRKLWAISKLPIFGKLMKYFKKIEAIPFIGRLFRALKFGFKWLGWPLTLLLSIIDFVKAWRATIGDWQAKLFAGLKAVAHGLLDFPLEVLGWAYDKVVGWFGIESAGTGNKLKEWLDKAMTLMLEFGPIGIITDIIKGFTTEGGFSKVIKDKFERVKEPLFAIIDFIAMVWNGFLQWAVDKTKKIPWLGKKVTKWAESLQLESPKTLPIEDNKLDDAQKTEKKKQSMQKKQADDLKKSVDEGTQATKDSSKKTEGAVNAMTAISQNNQGGGGSIEQRQIPDEIDNYVLSVKAYGGEFD